MWDFPDSESVITKTQQVYENTRNGIGWFFKLENKI